jgi:adenylate kinase
VSDEVMIGIVGERLGRSDAARGFVLDGFPRTVAQAIALDGLMKGRPPLIVVVIDVPEAELVRRLGSRMVCESCGLNADAANPPRPGPAGEASRCGRCGGRLKQRADDNESVVLERLKVYRRNTQPLVDYYRSRPTFRSIDGALSPDQVADALTRAIDALSGSQAGGPAGVGARR